MRRGENAMGPRVLTTPIRRGQGTLSPVQTRKPRNGSHTTARGSRGPFMKRKKRLSELNKTQLGWAKNAQQGGGPASAKHQKDDLTGGGPGMNF